ncbi:cytochrome c oxidase subunit CcoM [Halopseudomonas bauzanensis]|nr:cytochrome c oxidase subunit CcoM [Halopseudomonas bauzanensis]
MFIDDAVIAGLLTVGLMVVFLAGVGVFIYQDARKTSKKSS